MTSTLETIPGLYIVGSRVHSILYGGRDGTIFKIHGEQQPGTIRRFERFGVVSGGAAHFDIVFDHGTISLRVPEAIVRGVQWRLLDGIDTPEMIDQRLAHAAAMQAEREAQQKRAAEAKAAERAALPGRYPSLTVMDGKKSSHALGAANLRKHLRKEFPGVKFSVTSDSFSGGDAIDVRWSQGPTRDEVRKISDQYQDSDFNGMEDISECRDTVFPTVFGGAKYVNESREMGDASEIVAKSLCAIYGVPYAGLWTRIEQLDKDAGDYARRILATTSLPIGAKVTGAEWPEGQLSGEYRVTFETSATA